MSTKITSIGFVDPWRDPDETGIHQAEEIYNLLKNKDPAMQLTILVNLLAYVCYQFDVDSVDIHDKLFQLQAAYEERNGKDEGKPSSGSDPKSS